MFSPWQLKFICAKAGFVYKALIYLFYLNLKYLAMSFTIVSLTSKSLDKLDQNVCLNYEREKSVKKSEKV